MTAERLQGFAPILGAHTRVLILGSFPSVASLHAGHYYAHPRNAFWPILSEILGVPLVELPFEQRYQALRQHGVGLWDVVRQCQRQGSLDAAIRGVSVHEADAVLRPLPVKRLVFNGKTAAHWGASYAPWVSDRVTAPSTSPAHAGMPYAAKLAAWQQALATCLD